MKDLKKLFELLVSKLPKAAKTKLSKSSLDRGGGGVFTKRRKRSDFVLVPFESFNNNYQMDVNITETKFVGGYRVLCTPSEYFQNIDSLTDVPLLVRYETYEELNHYPPPIEWSNIKKDRKDYHIDEVMWVKDIKNLDKYKNEGESCYVGPKLVGQHEMDYANEEEILKVQMVLLYQMIKCHDFQTVMSDNPILEKYLEYCDKFEETSMYLDNPKLQEYVTKYGFTVCPIMSQFPNTEFAKISFVNIIDGVILGDTGRETFNRTTTKINLHHVDALESGKLNHNHKNVFLGTACGNGIDANLKLLGNGNITVSDLFKLK